LAVSGVGVLGITQANAIDEAELYRVMSFRDDKDPISGNYLSKAGATSGGATSYSGCGAEDDDLWDDANCAVATSVLQVRNYLPTCDKELALNCVESVSWRKDDGTLVKGALVSTRGSINPDFFFSRKEALGVSEATAPQIFTFAGLTHSKGNNFAVTGHITQDINKGVTAPAKILLSIAPVYSEIVPIDDEDERADCFNVNEKDSKCWKLATASDGVVFKTDLKLLNKPQGWISGRLTSPKVEITKTADTAKRFAVSIEGANIGIPTISKRYEFSNADQKAKWEKISTALNQSPWSDRRGVVIPWGPEAFSYFNKVVAVDKEYDVADKLAAVWRVVLDPTNVPKSYGSSCSTGDFQGFVSSNSMTYGTALPNYDGETMSYDVASPHYKPGGKDYAADAFSGRYDLLLTEAYARCVWGLKDALPKIEVNVYKTDGSVDNSAKVVGGLDTSGFFKFSATGFTFSSPKIKIKLTAPPTTGGTPAVTQEAAAPAAKAPAKVVIKSISCVKGKVVKKVSGSNPKCPAGFKQK
jgi:hypothetical protein